MKITAAGATFEAVGKSTQFRLKMSQERPRGSSELNEYPGTMP